MKVYNWLKLTSGQGKTLKDFNTLFFRNPVKQSFIFFLTLDSSRLKVDKSQYIALFVVSGSTKSFSQLIVSIFVFSQYFSIDFLGGKLWGCPTLLTSSFRSFNLSHLSNSIQIGSIRTFSPLGYF